MRYVFSVLLAVCCSVTTWASSRVDSLLLHLDQTVQNRQTYIDLKENHILHQRELAAIAEGTKRYDLLASLFELYNGFNTDSAIHYSALMHQQAARLNDVPRRQYADICMARCLAINGMYERAKEILLPMEPELYPENKAFFYKVCSSMYVWEAEFTTIAAEKQVAWSHIPALRDSTIRYELNPVWRVHEEALLIGGNYPHGGIALLRPILDTLAFESPFTRFLANSLGSFYNATSQTDSALCFFALSAISDLENGITEHASLREVALLLFRQGDVNRAFRYMQCCIADAEFCKARLRTIEMAGDMPFIIEAYRRDQLEHQDFLQLSFVVLAAFLVVITALLAYSFRTTRKLRKEKAKSDEARDRLAHLNSQLSALNEQLSTTVQSLRQSNRIRDTYVLQYMRECSEAFGKLEQYHQQLLRVATHENYQRLLGAVRSSDFIEENTRLFYQHFDETFLSLFPNFVEQFNELLRPDCRFPLPENRHLSTELRIFALIRLGVTDSDEIARFLRYSTKTVYNYRTAVRNRALGDRNGLEAAVRSL